MPFSIWSYSFSETFEPLLSRAASDEIDWEEFPKTEPNVVFAALFVWDDVEGAEEAGCTEEPAEATEEFTRELEPAGNT